MAEEKQFENKIKKILKDRGAWFLKTFSNGVQRAGVPDLIVCYKGTFMGIEVKAEKGVISPLQFRELDKIRKAGGVAFVVKPSEFDNFIEFLDKMDMFYEKIKKEEQE